MLMIVFLFYDEVHACIRFLLLAIGHRHLHRASENKIFSTILGLVLRESVRKKIVLSS
jgi:hypothetical protein